MQTPNMQPTPIRPDSNGSAVCDVVMASARGDASDSAEEKRHLERCPACRQAVRQVRLMVEVFRATDATTTGRHDPATAAFAARVLAAARRPTRLAPPPVRWMIASGSLAASMALALLAIQGPGVATDEVTAQSAPASRQMTIAGLSGLDSNVLPTAGAESVRLEVEVGAPSANRLPFALRTEGGTEQGEIDLSTSYVLETVPARAVVVDTF